VRARSRTFSAASRTASTADAPLAPLPSGARCAGRRRCSSLRRPLEPARYSTHLHLCQCVTCRPGILRPPKSGGGARRFDSHSGRHPAFPGDRRATHRSVARRLAFASGAGRFGANGHELGASARGRGTLGAVGHRARREELLAESGAPGVSRDNIRPRPPVLLRPENVEAAEKPDVTQDTRNLPLPATTGRLRSSCQATTRTLAMRRPSLKISARALVASGPAERR